MPSWPRIHFFARCSSMDAFPQWMLSSLHSAQGDAASANYYYGAAVGQQPGLPSSNSSKTIR
jgi:hypothetical protein